ncbi:3-ketoacyl-ACP reductase [Bordetella sp. BOR01]|uniref:3-ketoacyl-ACP reductase n=1 Tax=Bordetella sp. BOR01 TaxID=2854779 RepID=UPI001C48CA84|nr:3-ketoacyl-ACP reductase [Bordetella sp. BOR01]MBV7482972.1 3-ketoacyl-ACP reductase [Bordetella sp. BOR01]
MTNKIQVAVVTGARRGIGRAIVHVFARSGWRVVAIDVIEDDESRAVVEDAKAAGSDCRFILADIADTQTSASVCAAAYAAFGQVDCLVNNAGVMARDRTANVLETSVESFDRVMSVNLRGTYFFTQAFAREMVLRRRSNSAAYQSIVTVSSVNALHARTRAAEYSLSKAAIAMFTKILALQLASDDIACFDIQPGLIKTDLNASVHASYGPLVREGGVSPMARWGLSEDVATAVLTVASGGLRFATGQTLHIDGGAHIPRGAFENPMLRQHLASMSG